MKINEVVFDCENKEYVKISNGIPIVEGKPEIKPTEAIALRTIGLNEHGKPIIAWTYRKVNADRLAVLENQLGYFDILNEQPGKVNEHFSYIGRV